MVPQAGLPQAGRQGGLTAVAVQRGGGGGGRPPQVSVHDRGGLAAVGTWMLRSAGTLMAGSLVGSCVLGSLARWIALRVCHRLQIMS